MLRSRLLFTVTLLTLQTFATQAQATLVFYYDPDTGNVSLDTSELESGGILAYYLRINTDVTPFVFRNDNFIHLTNSTLFQNDDYLVAEFTFTPTIQGLYTIGDILPSGLSEETWYSTFSKFDRIGNAPGWHYYNEQLGEYPAPAELVYGRPEGEFKNRLDLLDPDALEWATSASLIYREATGELILDTQRPGGGYTTGIYLVSNNQFLPDGFVSPWESAAEYVDHDNIQTIADLAEPGIYNLGNVMHVGLSESEFRSAMTTAFFFNRSGFGTTDLDLETEGVSLALVYQAVPEPTAGILMVLGCSLMLFRRYRSE